MSHVRSLNRVILVGRVGQNPEVTTIASTGREVAKFSLATNEGYMDKNNQWKDQTEWHNIVAWGPLAQKVSRTVTKGIMLLVEGKLRTRKWQDKNGQERKNTDIEVENVVVLEKGNKETNTNSGFSKRNGNVSPAGENYAPPAEVGESLPERDINQPDDFPYEENSDPF